MKHFIVYIILVFVPVLSLNQLHASGNEKENLKESRVISGTVVDKISGESLPGAKIMVEGDNEAYYADLDGSFSVPHPSTDGACKLVVTHVSYKTYKEQIPSSDQNYTVTVELHR